MESHILKCSSVYKLVIEKLLIAFSINVIILRQLWDSSHIILLFRNPGIEVKFLDSVPNALSQKKKNLGLVEEYGRTLVDLESKDLDPKLEFSLHQLYECWKNNFYVAHWSPSINENYVLFYFISLHSYGIKKYKAESYHNDYHIVDLWFLLWVNSVSYYKLEYRIIFP